MPRFGYRKPVLDRLIPKTTVTPAGCFEWSGPRTKDGHGQINDYLDGRRIGTSTHRTAYRHLVGEVPDGLVLDHLCRNPACWNPDHLEPVTPEENNRRSPISLSTLNARKTHCLRGHALDAENTRLTANGRRICRRCQAASNHRHVARKKATMNTPTRVVAALAIAATLTLTACSTPSIPAGYQACVVELTDDAAQALDDALDIIDAGRAADLDTTKVRDVVETVRSADEICAGVR